MRISDWSSDVCSSDLEIPEQQRQQNAFDDAREDRDRGDTVRHYLLVPRVLMEWLFPVILTCSLYFLVRGHDLPGGGFAAGVTASIAIIVLYMASGTRSVEMRLTVQPVQWISAGLLCATATGMAARSEEHTSELQSLMRISYAVFCLKKKQILMHLSYMYPR